MIDRQKHLRAEAPTATAGAQSDGNEQAATEPRIGTLPITGPDDGNGRTGWFARWRKPKRGWFSGRASVPSANVGDLAQEVFFRLLRYSDDVAVENPQGYLFRIAANVANEWRDRERVHQPHDRSWLNDLQIDPSDPSDNTTFQTRVNKQMQSAVSRLPARQRQVLLLHVNEGLTYKQIAARLGVADRVVLRDLSRAYASLRMQLKAESL